MDYIEAPMDGNHGEIHPKVSDYVSSGVPFIMANNLSDGFVDLSQCAFITEKQAKSLRKGLLSLTMFFLRIRQHLVE